MSLKLSREMMTMSPTDRQVAANLQLKAVVEQLAKQQELTTRHIMAGNTVLGLLLQAACELHDYVPEMVDGVPTGRLLKLTFKARWKKRLLFWR